MFFFILIMHRLHRFRFRFLRDRYGLFMPSRQMGRCWAICAGMNCCSPLFNGWTGLVICMYGGYFFVGRIFEYRRSFPGRLSYQDGLSLPCAIRRAAIDIWRCGEVDHARIGQ